MCIKLIYVEKKIIMLNVVEELVRFKKKIMFFWYLNKVKYNLKYLMFFGLFNLIDFDIWFVKKSDRIGIIMKIGCLLFLIGYIFL